MDAKAGSFQSETVDASHNDGRAFYQVSTLNALMMGNFDGVVSVGELKRHGSWGIGTYEGLDASPSPRSRTSPRRLATSSSTRQTASAP